MSPTVGSIWARAMRIGPGDHPGSIAVRVAERAEAPARVQPMRDRRRHLVGFSVAALLLLAAAPAAASASVGLADGVASLASPSQKPFIAPKPRPTEARQRPTDDPDPNRNAYTVPQAPKSPKCGRLLLRALGGRGDRRPQPHRLRRQRRPRLRRAGAEGRRTRARSRERQARLARAEERRAQGRRGRQDRHLPLPDRRRTVRLRGPRPRPGDQAAPAAAPPARLPGPRQRLQRLRVPRHHGRPTTSR